MQQKLSVVLRLIRLTFTVVAVLIIKKIIGKKDNQVKQFFLFLCAMIFNDVLC